MTRFSEPKNRANSREKQNFKAENRVGGGSRKFEELSDFTVTTLLFFRSCVIDSFGFPSPISCFHGMEWHKKEGFWHPPIMVRQAAPCLDFASAG